VGNTCPKKRNAGKKEKNKESFFNMAPAGVTGPGKGISPIGRGGERGRRTGRRYSWKRKTLAGGKKTRGRRGAKNSNELSKTAGSERRERLITQPAPICCGNRRKKKQEGWQKKGKQKSKMGKKDVPEKTPDANCRGESKYSQPMARASF